MRSKRFSDRRLRCLAPAVLVVLFASPHLMVGCESTTQVNATPPTVSYSYAADGEVATWERAEDYCARYGLEPVVISRDPDRRHIAYACE